MNRRLAALEMPLADLVEAAGTLSDVMKGWDAVCGGRLRLKAAGFRVTADLIELRNLVEVADLIVRSALSRKESRGLHYTLDYPDMLPNAVDTVLVP